MKMTKATAFAIAAEHMATVDAEVAEILTKEVARLTAPRKGGKPTKKQEEGMEIKAALIATMEAEKAYTMSELTALLGGVHAIQKVTALVTQLVKAGALTKIVEGRKSTYMLVEDAD